MQTENLDKVRASLEDYLRDNHFIVFRGAQRNVDEARFVFWDVDEHPDYLEFIKTAEQVGIRLIVVYTQRFDEALLEDLENSLEGLALPRDEHRAFEKRIKDLRPYTGKTSQIELSFAYDNQVYIYAVASTWYEDYEDLYEELMLTPPEFDGEEEDNESMGGFFSKN